MNNVNVVNSFIDTHAHLYLDSFDEDREEVIRRAVEAGLQYIFLPNIDTSSIPYLASLISQHPGYCFPMMGLHPTSVKHDYREQMGVIEMELRKNPERYCAVGEIGIDLYWDKTFAKEQEDVFDRQLELALEFDLPVAIHTRNSMDIALEICAGLRAQSSEHRAQSSEHRAQSSEHRAQSSEHRAQSSGLRAQSSEHRAQSAEYRVQGAGLRGVFHCFSGNIRQAERAIELGFMLGIGGVITFKNSGLQQVVEAVPLEHLLLETDAPFLAPVPFRGQRNEPAYIPFIAEKIAALKKITVEEVAAVTTRSAMALFGGGTR